MSVRRKHVTAIRGGNADDNPSTALGLPADVSAAEGEDLGRTKRRLKQAQEHLESYISRLTGVQDDLEDAAYRLSKLRLDTRGFIAMSIWDDTGSPCADDADDIKGDAGELQNEISVIVSHLAFDIGSDCTLSQLRGDLAAFDLVAFGGLEPFCGDEIIQAWCSCVACVREEPEQEHLLGVAVPTNKWVADLRLRVSGLVSVLRREQRDYEKRLMEKGPRERETAVA